MPVKINTYACNFRCGYTNTKKKAVLKHEKNCSSNPAKKGCKTCSFFIRYKDDNGLDGAYREEWEEVYCSLYRMKQPSENNEHGLRFNCEYWETKK